MGKRASSDMELPLSPSYSRHEGFTRKLLNTGSYWVKQGLKDAYGYIGRKKSNDWFK